MSCVLIITATDIFRQTVGLILQQPQEADSEESLAYRYLLVPMRFGN